MNRVLWKAKLDSDFNERYWRYITEKYSKRDFALKLLVALTASGTVASWGVFERMEELWKALSATAALASIASPLLAYGKKVETAASHAGKWADLRIRYDELWEIWQSKRDIDLVNREHANLQKITIELTRSEPGLRIPEDKSLGNRAQQDVVVKATGLNLEAQRGNNS